LPAGHVANGTDHRARGAGALGVREPALTFGKLALVGASGVAVNLAVYVALLRVATASWWVAASVAFLVAALSNLAWNRWWTFAGRRGRVGVHAVRFAGVVVASYGVGIVALGCLRPTLGAVEAQILAVLVTAPLSFAAHRRWSFGRA
jgi:putative flippase GtrA